MSATAEAKREPRSENYGPELQDLDGNILENVGNFFEKYFEKKSWSVAARSVADSFNPSDSEGLVDNGSHESFPESFVRYQKTFPLGCNTYCTSTSQPLAGFNECDTPTFYLVRAATQELQQEYKWADVRVFGQFSPTNDGKRAQDRMLFFMHAWRLFNNQPTRRFVHGFHICGPILQLWVFDRAGAYACTPFSIDEDSNRFLIAIAGYAMMSDEELGLNSFIQDDASSKYINLKGQDRPEPERLYLEDQPIRRFPGIMYKGPTCYRVRRLGSQGWEFVAKFAWQSISTTAEQEITRLVTERKVWGVVQLFAHQNITSIDDMRCDLDFKTARAMSLGGNACEHADSSTESSSHDGGIENLAFYCVVIHPVGRPIEDYDSALELICAFRDVIKGHRSLYFDGKILHQDLSKDNIMISITQREGTPRGFLIDLDSARKLDENAGEGERRGTRAFMAIAVLLAQTHTYRHDLEGLFYCFLWIAICKRGHQWPPQGSLLWAWFQGDFEECAQSKSKDMQVDGFASILDEFSEELADFRGLARELWCILFPKQDGSLLLGSDAQSEDPHAFYQSMIDAFDRAAASLERSV